MQPLINARPASRSHRGALALALLAVVGCAGGSGGTGCGSSCGGAFVTKGPDGQPITFSGTKLDNVAQVRVTKSGFAFLNETHLNDLLTRLNGNAPALTIPCTDLGTLVNACAGTFGFHFSAIAADMNFNGVCDPGEGATVGMTFKKITWGFDQQNQILRAKLLTHIKTDNVYIRTKEAHSSGALCGQLAPVQGRVFYDDENPSLQQQDTEIDLDIKFTPSPDGRMELNVTDQSLAAIVDRFDPGAIFIDGFTGAIPPPATGKYNGDGCDSSASGTYPVVDPNNTQDLTCGGFLRVINAECDPTDGNPKGLCLLFQKVRDYLLNTLKNQFAPQIVALLRKEIDKTRCQRSADSTGAAHDCNNTNFRCPNDDNGTPLTCDTSRAVCVPQGQSPLDPGTGGGTVPQPDGGTVAVGQHNCEPIPVGLTGQLDVSGLTDKVGFPPSAGLLVTMGLGSKSGSAVIDSGGVQLSAMAGTAPPPGSPVSLCVPPSIWQQDPPPPALNFDDPNNKPAAVGTYDLGFSLASQMVNRGLYDAYSASLLCVSLTNKTTPFISSGLFKTFLPSLGLITGGRDVPMAVLLRPTQPPFVRIGRGTLKQLPDGTFAPDDPLLTVNFKAMNLDFYALVDERQVRLFTLQADLNLPLGLRTFPGAQADTLQPVLGGLDTVLTNIKALNNQMLAEDPGVVRDLLGAAVRLAQPLLAGVLKPVQLPSTLGLKLYVGGLAGAVPVSANLQQDGYQHLAIYGSLAECTPAAPCERYSVKTEARIVSRFVPADLDEVRGENHPIPSVDIEASALQARHGTAAQFSWRIDAGLWSPWVSGPRFTIRDQIFLFQGRHTIEVTAREAGDDHTQDLDPVSLEFFVSFEPPSVELYQRADGSVATRAHSVSSRDDQLLYSYRLSGEGSWSTPGEARSFSANELGGRGLWVSASDPGGKAAMAHFGADDASSALALGTVGCATSSRSAGPAAVLLALAGLLALRRRSRRAE